MSDWVADTHPTKEDVNDYLDVDTSDDEMDWEEIELPVKASSGISSAIIGPGEDEKVDGTLEITVKAVSRKRDNNLAKQRAAAIQAERVARLMCHKLHTVALLSNALCRNKWINDRLLQARLLSLVPLPIQNSFSSISKARHPDAAKRGRLFEAAVIRLTQWWHESFEVLDSGHIQSRTFADVQREIDTGEYLQAEGELIRSPKSLMKHALMRRGCRDTSAQLFTSLCRALAIPARLVVSLQGVPWQANSGGNKSKGTGKRRGKHNTAEITDEGGESNVEGMNTPTNPGPSTSGGNLPISIENHSLSESAPSGKGKGRAQQKPVIRLRKQKSKGQRLGSVLLTVKLPAPAPPIGGYPPVFWTEVFSRPDGRWMPVDPIRCMVNKRKVFEPPAHDKSNRMVYVVAIEEDGYGRDVTPRYAREYGAKTTKVQLGGKGKKEWWEQVMVQVTRPFRLNRDDVEDEEFEFHQFTEGMPSSVAGFKDHPLYVLEQHLKRDEVVFPLEEVGKFRGDPVYPRSNVIALKTAENWMRSGRRVREGCQPMKMVKQRAVTVHRRRAVEMAQQGGEEVLQGLYSKAQTELLIPDPVIDGVVPKNEFGNIDLYVPSMLPAGSAHIPFKGVAKIAKKLGFDYAEAVTSFEFKKGRAFPVLTGIIVAAENEEALLEAYWESERDQEEKERAKRKEKVLQRWSRLIQAMRIRRRLREQYTGIVPGTGNGVPQGDEAQQLEEAMIGTEHPGGFLTEADSVIQPFQLPKPQHFVYQPLENNETEGLVPDIGEEKDQTENPLHTDELFKSESHRSVDTLQIDEDSDADGGMATNDLTPSTIDPQMPLTSGQFAPKTMQEYAEQMKLDSPDKVLDSEMDTNQGRDLQKDDSSLSEQHARSVTQSGSARKTGIRGSGTIRDKAKGNNANSSVASGRNKVNKPRGRRRESDESGVSEAPDEVSVKRTRNTGSRKRKRGEVTDTTPVSTRVLRSRVPKSAEKLRLEREAEDAFRRAVEE